MCAPHTFVIPKLKIVNNRVSANLYYELYGKGKTDRNMQNLCSELSQEGSACSY